MKITCLILFNLMLLLGGNSKNVLEAKGKTNKLIVINKDEKYPLKLMKIEDVADVTYIPLETNKQILLDKDAHVDFVGKDRIIVTNPAHGDLFVFDMNGKALFHFNHRGGNGYSNISCVAYDEIKKEIYILDHLAKKILVFSESGALKRTFRLPADSSLVEIVNFDDKSLLAFHEHQYGPVTQTKPFMFLSKADGTVISKLNITINKPHPKFLMEDDGPNSGRGYTIAHSNKPENCKFGKDLILAKASCDTIYLLKQDRSLTPLFVHNPSVYSEHPVAVTVGMKTDNFMTFFLYSNDLKEVKSMTNSGKNYSPSIKPRTLLYEFKTNQFFEYKGSIGASKVDLPENTGVFLVTAQALINELKKDLLKGKTKEMASKLQYGDNPVVKLIKFKK